MSVLQEKSSNLVTQAEKPSFLDKYTQYMALTTVHPEVAPPSPADLPEPAQTDVAENNADRLAFADIGQTVDAAEWARLMAKHGRPQPEDTRPPLPVELWYAGDGAEAWRLFNEYRETYQCRMNHREGVYCVFSVLPVAEVAPVVSPLFAGVWVRDVADTEFWKAELMQALVSLRADIRRAAVITDKWLCGEALDAPTLVATLACINPQLQFKLKVEVA